MPALTPVVAFIVFTAGAGAGALGALLGIGGGVFLVPFLNLVLGFPIKSAAAISLSTVIAASSSVSAGRAGRQVINLRLGMVLEVATVAGSLLGGITAQLFAESTMQHLFGVVALLVAAVMLTRLNRRNVILDLAADSTKQKVKVSSRIASNGFHSRSPRRSLPAMCRRCSVSAAA